VVSKWNIKNCVSSNLYSIFGKILFFFLEFSKGKKEEFLLEWRKDRYEYIIIKEGWWILDICYSCGNCRELAFHPIGNLDPT
jgi:hypothetical protein